MAYVMSYEPLRNRLHKRYVQCQGFIHFHPHTKKGFNIERTEADINVFRI
jgi:hypothetical protein